MINNEERRIRAMEYALRLGEFLQDGRYYDTKMLILDAMRIENYLKSGENIKDVK